MSEEQKRWQGEQGAYREDEISLVELWLILARRKGIVIGILIVSITLGAAYALVREPVFRYTTVVELAKTGHEKPVETASAARTRVAQVIIPIVRSEMSGSQAVQGKMPPQARVRISEGGGHLLEITSEYPKAAHDDIMRFHAHLLNALTDAHDGMVAMERDRLLVEQETIRNEIKRIEVEKQRINARIEEAGTRLAAGRDLQRRSPGEPLDTARTMTLLIIQSRLEDAFDKLLALEAALYQELPARVDKLSLRLGEINSRLAGITMTRVHVTALISEYPVGTGRRMIASLSLVLGIMAGVFAAFFAEFLSHVRSVARNR